MRRSDNPINLGKRRGPGGAKGVGLTAPAGSVPTDGQPPAHTLGAVTSSHLRISLGVASWRHRHWGVVGALSSQTPPVRTHLPLCLAAQRVNPLTL